MAAQTAYECHFGSYADTSRFAGQLWLCHSCNGMLLASVCVCCIRRAVFQVEDSYPCSIAQ